jgi:phenylacetic acid degradation operon negative regulatory protein
LWPLDALAADGRRLAPLVHDAIAWLADAGATALADTFLVSVAAVRYLSADPLLPREIVGEAWPADEVRRAYDQLERQHRRVTSAFVAAT